MHKQEMFLNIEREIKEEKQNYKGVHCCLTMDSELLGRQTIFHYSLQYREYGIRLPESTGYVLMDHCIACGQKLPVCLREKWFDILEYEYGLDRPREEDKKKIPKEFLTDEWWKERGL